MIVMAVVQAGSVGTFFTVTIQEAIRVRDAPVSHKVTASLNVEYVFFFLIFMTLKCCSTFY